MAYSANNIKQVREILNERRSRSIADYERRRSEAQLAIPALLPISEELHLTGSRIMDAALAHALDRERLNGIKQRNEELLAMQSALLEEAGYPADFLNIKYHCALCADTGYEGVNMCACMKRELTLAGFRSSGLAALMDHQTFDTFSLSFYTGPERRRMEQNVALLRGFAEHFSKESRDNWLLLGATGLGKTHLSTAVAKAVIERGYDVVYETAQALISRLEAKRFGGDYTSDAESRFLECDLLIVDDLGVEISNQFTLSCIYNVINTRIVGQRATIISTNLTQSELRQRYADRITSRLFGEFRPLSFTGEDIRRQKMNTKNKNI